MLKGQGHDPDTFEAKIYLNNTNCSSMTYTDTSMVTSLSLRHKGI